MAARFGTLHDKFNDQNILRLAGALESKSEHPLAMGIMEKIKAEKTDIPDAENFNAISGKGIEADVGNQKVKVVSPNQSFL